MVKALLKPEFVSESRTQAELQRQHEVQVKYYDQSARDLLHLWEGYIVRMKPFQTGEKKWQRGVVTARLDERWYLIDTPDGGSYRKNKFHLKKTQEPPPISEPDRGPLIVKPMTLAPNPEGPKKESAAKSPPNQQPQLQSATASTVPERPKRLKKPAAYLQDYVRT